MSDQDPSEDVEKGANLPKEADALFEALREPVAGDERSARIVQEVTRQLNTDHADEDEAESWLLQAPLPLENGEPRYFGEFRPDSAAPARPSDARSLKEIAADAVAGQKQGQPALLGSAKLASGASETANRLRSRAVPPAPPTTLASAREAAKTRPKARKSPEALPVKRGGIQAAPTEAANARATKSGQSTWIWLGGAVAAAAALVFSLRPAERAPAHPEPPLAAQESTDPALAATEKAVPRAPTPPAEPAQTPADLPAESRTVADSKSPITPKKSVAGKAASRKKPGAQQPVASAVPENLDETPAEKVVLEEEDAPKERAGAAVPQMVPAAQPSSRSLRPSIGAAQGALGAVLGKAKFCVLGATSPSRATVVFGSSGRVSAVSVSGPAAGTPAEACIIKALGGARVQPFSDDEFSVRTTVRP